MGESSKNLEGMNVHNKLTATKVKAIVKTGVPGYHGDGAGLWLQISKTGGASWSFRFMLNGRAREMGLGPEKTVRLDEARDKAREARKILLDGVDPIEQKKSSRLVVHNVITFAEVADKLFAAQSEPWSHKYRLRWRATMRDYVLPHIGNMPVDKVGVGDITKILEPLFKKHPVTAAGVRGRLESVLGYATTMQWRTGDNPARWQGHLETVFSKPRSVAHREALPISEMPAFMQKLKGRDKPICRAMELVILTASREAMVRLMTWEEVDLDKGLWTIPAERMKAGKEHTVPLSKQAVELLQSMPRTKDRVFSYSGSAVWFEMRRLLGEDTKVTLHGFRSTFRDWGGDHTEFERETIEHALAHQLKDKSEASYRRSSALNKRRLLMQAWANYCQGIGADTHNVVAIHKTA
jgi:integrase